MEKDEEPRYVHLLQPNRDLAANWAVDVARELESYLAGLSLVSIPDEEGHESFNFAEAALLIQGSIQIYSRKVEYLYALVLQALDFIANKKQAQRESSSIQENGKDADIIEDQEEDFLNLDDVPEETNIDIVDEQKESSCITPAVRPPACLLVVEGENVDIPGDAGELASYQISISSLHRDFLLLDPCDAKFVDEYWREKAQSQVTRDSDYPGNTPGQRNPTIVQTPGCNYQHANQDAGPSGTAQRSPRPPEAFNFDTGADDWHNDDEENDAWVDNDAGAAQDIDGNGGPQHTNQGCDRSNQGEEVPDPWAPLNPHESGTLPVVPYRRGRPNKRRKAKKLRETLLEPAVSELGRVWQALESLEREAWRAKQSEEPPPYEKLRSSFIAKRTPLIGSEWSFDRSDKDSDNEDSRSDDEGLEEPATYHPDAVEDFGSQDPSQQTSHVTEHLDAINVETELNEVSNLEELCQAQLDAVLKKHAESEKLTELANRVVSWNKKIEKHLAIQEAHPPFDIHAYGERILDRLSLEDHGDEGPSDVQKPFTDIVAGLEKHEVARTFAALLQLVNNGNVALMKGSESNLPECFTAEHPFAVKLLSCRKPHEEMLHYRAPSSRRKKSSARKKGKGVPLLADDGDENLAIHLNFGEGQASFMAMSPRPFLAIGKSRRLSGGIGRSEVEREVMESFSIASPTAKSNTPEGKRRRRRQSLKAVQVRLAG
ncbi:hypothetical protein GOP47_0023846 [Adiantum capillus-veneris]|uniref:Condensin-2 complex subunit H2 n=1 Tax=Adiantum capillus-veneris TaxID=13818 RepID=A0A9D4U4A2_ADICA|nr:hypothetical protein GOP47_0023846 [Adiantum capillus-veneris]